MVCLLLYTCGNVHASTIYVPSLALSDVQAAIDSANTGDIVILPSGSETWTGTLAVNKEITIQGQGYNSTIITNALTTNYTKLINVTIDSNTPTGVKITGIGFKANGDTIHPYHIQISNDSEFIITNCKFYGSTNSDDMANAIMITGYGTYGVISSCIFYDAATEVINVKASNQTWSEDPNLGENNFVFIEDCSFDGVNVVGGHACTIIYGARVVFRYNKVHKMDFDVHGRCFEVDHNGGRLYEVYTNTFYSDGKWIYGLNLRGGTGVVYNNKFYENGGGFIPEIRLTEYRVGTDCPNGGCCPSSEGGEGYPCYDQIGRGKDQNSEPLYIWNNKLDCDGDGLFESDASISVEQQGSECSEAQTVDYIKNIAHDGEDNPDYYVDIQKPGYSPYTYPHPLRGIKTLKGISFSGGISTQ